MHFGFQNRPSFNAGGLYQLLVALQPLRLCPGGMDAFSCNARHCWFHWIFQFVSGVLKVGVKFSTSSEGMS